MRTHQTLKGMIQRIAAVEAGKASDPVGQRSNVLTASSVTSEASVNEKTVLTAVMQTIAKLIPHHFRGSGGRIVQQEPPSMRVTIKAFEVDGGIVAGGKLHTVSQDVVLDLTQYTGQYGRFYVMLNGSIVYISRVRNQDHGCLGAIILNAASRRIVDDDPMARSSSLDAEPVNNSSDGYIVSGRDPMFDDFAAELDDPYMAALRNAVNEIAAENLVGTIRLTEGLIITNAAGTMQASSASMKFFNSDGATLAEYGATRAFVGNIELLPTALQSRNYVAGSSGFKIADNGSCELREATVRGGIYADSGWIGGQNGWVITAGSIKGDSGYLGICTVAGNATYAMWISNDTPANANFSVTHAGILTAVGAHISGYITAASIDIGGADTTSFHVDVDGNMWLGAALFADATFSVTNDGVVKAKEVNGVRPYVQHYADTYALELELMKMNFQYVSWAQFAIFDAFDNSAKRASPDPSTYDARVWESKLDNGGDTTADREFGFVSKPYYDITHLFAGQSTSVGAGFLEDIEQSWFTDEVKTLTLVDNAATEFTILSNTSIRITVSGTPLDGDYYVKEADPGYCIAFLSCLDHENGGYGGVKYEVSFDGGSNYQVFYDTINTPHVDLREATQVIDNSGNDFIVRLTLKNDGSGNGPYIYKFLICTDPSPWRW